MAEVVGTVASAIGIADFAAQIASGIIKAKAFWDQVKEAPDEIKDLMLGADILRLILLDIEDYNRKHTFPDYIIDATNVKTSLEHCRGVSLQLEDLIEKLDSQMTSGTRIRKTLAAVNTALKKDQIKKIKTKLETAVQYVKFTQDRYEREIINLQLSRLIVSSEIINLDQPNLLTYKSNLATEFTDLQATQESPIPDSSYNHAATTGTTIAYRKKTPKRTSMYSSWWVIGCKLLGCIDYETEVYSMVRDWSDQRSPESLATTSQQTRVKVRPPSWIARKAWEAYRRQQHGEWKFTFRAYNIVEKHSPILRCIRANDIAGVQDLFVRKEATPYDKNMRGFSLVEYALGEASLKILSTDLIIFLIGQMSSIENMSDASGMFFQLLIQGSVFRGDDFAAICYQLSVLIHKSNLLDYSDSVPEALSWFTGTTSQFMSVIAYLLPEYNNYTQAKRMQSILAKPFYGVCSPYFIWAALRPEHGVLGLEIAQATCSRNDKTLLHICAGYLAVKNYGLYEEDLSATRLAMVTSNLYMPPWTYIPKDDTSLLARLLIESGADMHTISNDDRTPMLEAIWSRANSIFLFSEIDIKYFLSSTAAALKNWLRALKLAGVDLQKYGEIEKSLCIAGKVNQDMELGPNWRDYDLGKPQIWRLINFTYGPNVDDWHIWGSEITDQYAGEFWEMVDHPEWNMPGAWPVEDMN